jgi:hypothetical protein
MNITFASEKFVEVFAAFQELDSKIREELRGVRPEQFEDLVADLDAIIPGLEDDRETLGIALVAKANALYDAHLARLAADPPPFYDPATAPQVSPEALPCAIRGAALLERSSTARNVRWAKSVVELLSGSDPARGDQGAAAGAGHVVGRENAVPGGGPEREDRTPAEAGAVVTACAPAGRPRI